jgi:hypothetical protein
MCERWPQIASWFGLKGVPPSQSANPEDPKPSDFINKHRSKLVEAGVKGVDIGTLNTLIAWLLVDI